MTAHPPPKRVGIIGCGNICPIYVQNSHRFPTWNVAAVADLDPARARAIAEAHGIARVLSPSDLITDPAIDVVLNLTPPALHGPIGLAALRAGKHLYTEKPLAIALPEARALVHEAETRGLRLGCAPDTFLGAGLSAAKASIDRGDIGTPIGGTACMAYGGPEAWHPDPELFYAPGAGPLMDMGPYYLTAAIQFLGPIARVSAFTRQLHSERTIATGPKAGQRFGVTTPTHIAGQVEFVRGGILTLVMSFEVARHRLPVLEIYGTQGAIAAPDPNTFGGPVTLLTGSGEVSRETPVPVPEAWSDNSRGLGLHEMVESLAAGRPHRASGALGLHVLEAMTGLLESGRTGRAAELSTRVDA